MIVELRAAADHILSGINGAGSPEKLELMRLSSEGELATFRRDLRYLPREDIATRSAEIAEIQELVTAAITEKAASFGS